MSNNEIVAEAISTAMALMEGKHKHDVWAACDIASSRWELSDEECYILYAAMGIKYSG
jgi:hypothetical protein